MARPAPVNTQKFTKDATRLFRKGRYDEVVTMCENALKQDSKNIEAWNMKGNALLELEQTDDAIACFNKVDEIDNRYIDAYEWNDKGNAIFGLERYDDAINYYRKAIKLDSNFAWPWRNLGFVYQTLKDYDAALENYNKALSINQDNPTIWNDKGNAFFDLGMKEEALQCYSKAIEIDPENALFWINKGAAFSNLGRFSEAIESSNKAVKLDPNYTDAWYTLGDVLFDAGKYEDALECYKKVVEIDPEFLYGWSGIALTLTYLNRLEESKHYYRKTLENVTKALELNSIPDFWVLKSNCHRCLEDYQQAEDCCRQALELDPDHLDGILSLTIILSEHKSENKEALELAKKLMALYPENITVGANYVELLLKNLHFNEAQEMALKLIPMALTNFDKCLLKYFVLTSAVFSGNTIKIDKELTSFCDFYKSTDEQIIIRENRWYFDALVRVILSYVTSSTGRFILLSLIDLLQGRIQMKDLKIFVISFNHPISKA